MANIPLPPGTQPTGMTIDADGANGQTGGVPVYAPKGFVPALPSHWRAQAVGVVLGCKATVEDIQTGKILKASAVLDFGPKAKLGEASIACAKFFGVIQSETRGHERETIYLHFLPWHSRSDQ